MATIAFTLLLALHDDERPYTSVAALGFGSDLSA